MDFGSLIGIGRHSRKALLLSLLGNKYSTARTFSTSDHQNPGRNGLARGQDHDASGKHIVHGSCSGLSH